MVLISAISSKFNRFIAPKLLKNSLLARYALSQNKPIIVDNPYIDSFFLIPLAQTLISIEVQHVAKEEEEEEEKKRQQKHSTKKSAMDDFVDRVWDKYLEPMSPSPLSNDTTANENSNDPPRLKAFTEYIRPALTPNNVFGDINRWRFHNRFVKWLRSEYLICKYENEIRAILASHPKLKHSALLSQARSKLRDTMRHGLSTDVFDSGGGTKYAKSLPTVTLLNDAFQMHHWNKTKSTLDENQQMKHLTTKRLNGTVHNIPGTSIEIPDVDNDQDLQSLTLEEVLEVAGCHVSSCNAFNALCDDAGIYEFWTEEYVRQLSNYLMERCQHLSNADGKDVVIVDVGAGDGTLVKFIRENIITKRTIGGGGGKKKKHLDMNNNKGRGRNKQRKNVHMSVPTIVATDDGSWNIKPKANVEILSVAEAMDKYSPYKDNSEPKSKQHHLIVICSWMPMGDDWTKAFRDAAVDEYILIGECDDGNCGHNWYTWGNQEFFEGVSEDQLIPDYLLDGYQRREIDDLSRLQFSRFDSVVSSGSKTISFQKVEK